MMCSCSRPLSRKRPSRHTTSIFHNTFCNFLSSSKATFVRLGIIIVFPPPNQEPFNAFTLRVELV